MGMLDSHSWLDSHCVLAWVCTRGRCGSDCTAHLGDACLRAGRAMELRPRLWASSRPLISRRWCAGLLSGAMPPSTRFFLVASVLWRLASIVFEKLGNYCGQRL